MVSATRQLATVLNFQGRVDPSVERAVNGLTGAQRRVARQLIDDNYRQQRAISATARQVVGGTRNLQSYSQEIRSITDRMGRLEREADGLRKLGANTDDVDEAARRYSNRLEKVQQELGDLYSTPFGQSQRQQFEELQDLARGAGNDFQRWRNQAQWITGLDEQLKQAKASLGQFRAESGRLRSAGQDTFQLTRQMEAYQEEIEGTSRELNRLRTAQPGSEQVEPLRRAERAVAALNMELGQTAMETRQAARQTENWQHVLQTTDLDGQLKQARKSLSEFRQESSRLKSAGRDISRLTNQTEEYEKQIEDTTAAIQRLRAAPAGPHLLRPLREANDELTQINRRLAQAAEETREAARAAERWQRRLQRVDRVAGGIRNTGFGLAGVGGGAIAATLIGGEQASVHREAALQAGFSLQQYFVNTQALRRLGARDQIDLQRELGKEGRARLVDPSEETVFAIQRIAEARGTGYEATQRDLIETLSGPNAVRDIVLEVRRAGKDLQPFFAEALIGGEGGERLLEVVTRTIADIEQAFAQASPRLAASLDVSTETLADMRIGMENLQFRAQLVQSAFATGLIPLMTEFAESITPAVMGLQNFASENPRAAQAVAGLTLTVGGLGVGLTGIGLLAPGLIRSILGIRAAVIALSLAMRANPLFAIAGLLATAAALGLGAFLINRFVSATPYEPANRVPRETTGEIITTGLEDSEGRGRRDPRTGILLEGIPFQPITPVGNPCPELAELEKQTAIQRDIEANTRLTLPVTEPEGKIRPFFAIDTTTPDSAGERAGQAVRNYLTEDFQDFFANPGRAFEPGTLLGNLNDEIGDLVMSNIRNLTGGAADVRDGAERSANALPAIPDLREYNPLNRLADDFDATLRNFARGVFGNPVSGTPPSGIPNGPLDVPQGVMTTEERRLEQGRLLNPRPIADPPQESSDGFLASLSRFLGLGGGGQNGGATNNPQEAQRFYQQEFTINQTINGGGVQDVADAVGTATMNALEQVDDPNN